MLVLGDGTAAVRKRLVFFMGVHNMFLEVPHSSQPEDPKAGGEEAYRSPVLG